MLLFPPCSEKWPWREQSFFSVRMKKISWWWCRNRSLEKRIWWRHLVLFINVHRYNNSYILLFNNKLCSKCNYLNTEIFISTSRSFCSLLYFQCGHCICGSPGLRNPGGCSLLAWAASGLGFRCRCSGVATWSVSWMFTCVLCTLTEVISYFSRSNSWK